MNEKEVAELRRRFQQDRSGISHVRGCYVNENREIVSQFDQPLGVMTQEENEKILGLLKRTLSGTLGKNLLDITFATQQVVHGEEHKLLMALRSSELGDEDAVQAFFQKVISTVTLEGNYMILLVHDAYDVPYRSQDGDKQDDASSEVFSYILCSVCPVKLTKPALSYYVQQNEFHNRTADWVVARRSWAFCSRPSMTAPPTCTTPSTTPSIQRTSRALWWKRCSAPSPPCPQTSSRRPFTPCWRSPWRRSVASRWSRRSTTSCAA